MAARPVSAERLHADDLELLADLIAERLRAEPVGPQLLTVADVAGLLQVGEDFVRDNADALGVIRLGDGPRPRLRFTSEGVAAFVAGGCSAGERSTSRNPPSRARSRRKASSDRAIASGLLPLSEL